MVNHFPKITSRIGKSNDEYQRGKGFEYGSGFVAQKMTGKEHNDLSTKILPPKTNFSGGIQGGISNGMDIYFRVAFKPILPFKTSRKF